MASIIGVAGAGFRLSLILNAVSCEIANAPTEIHAISKSVTLFSLLLKQTAAILDQAASVHSDEAIRTAEQVLQESNAVFKEIDDMLERMRSKREDATTSPSLTQRFRWCFKKHSVLYLLGRMDRLQMSLSLMLQIIQLGTSMASTSRNDPPEKVREMSDKIRRERVEAQNVVVLYYFENKEVERLYEVAKNEQLEPHSPIEFRKEDGAALSLVSSSEDSQLVRTDASSTITDTDLTVNPPMRVLTDFDDSWIRMDRSPADMIKVSDQAINRLLERWTIWRERRDQELRQPRSAKSSQYRSNVQDSHDDDDSAPFFERYQEREDNLGGKFLEGPTTDWRKPHSAEARHNAARLRKVYAGYQASVSAESSDVDNSAGSTGSKKRAPRRHVLDSGDESSEPEPEKPAPRRRSSALVPFEQTEKIVVQSPMSRSFSTTSTGFQAQPPASQAINPPTQSPYQPRPFPSPDQNMMHHSFSSPAPAQYSNSGVYHYSPVSGPQPPAAYMASHPHQQTYPFPQGQSHPLPPPRYVPRLSPQSSRQVPPRPVPQEGKPPRSPSRLSHPKNVHTPGRYKETEEERRARKKQLRREIGDGAAKTLLAGGGLAVFLEALEALDL